MDVLIRRLTSRVSSAITYSDLDVETDELSIGAGADLDLTIQGSGVATDHARVQRHRKGFQIVCRRGTTVNVNNVKI